jgi:hypothetical protein
MERLRLRDGLGLIVAVLLLFWRYLRLQDVSLVQVLGYVP